jgi:hypothetical protein
LGDAGGPWPVGVSVRDRRNVGTDHAEPNRRRRNVARCSRTRPWRTVCSAEDGRQTTSRYRERPVGG